VSHAKPAARCTDCGEATPGGWLDSGGSCPWCSASEKHALAVLDAACEEGRPEEREGLRDCTACGVAILPAPHFCPCARKTRDRLDEAEYEVEERGT
jgi:hypothetical protein